MNQSKLEFKKAIWCMYDKVWGGEEEFKLYIK